MSLAGSSHLSEAPRKAQLGCFFFFSVSFFWMLARPQYSFAGVLGLITLLKTLLCTMCLIVPHIRPGPACPLTPATEVESLPALGVFLLNSNNCVFDVLCESILNLF